MRKDKKAKPTLTPREMQVLKLVADGLTDDQIADKLKVSIYTPGVHRAHIFSKLGVANAANAVQYAFRQKWLA